MLNGIAQQPNVVHVDTPGTLADNEWNDELHPSRKGFQKIAGKFRDQLKLQFPRTF
jgi:lysophospholipase L1-like esterase